MKYYFHNFLLWQVKSSRQHISFSYSNVYWRKKQRKNWIPLQSRSAIFQIQCSNSPYKTETHFTKNTQSFNVRPLDFERLQRFWKDLQRSVPGNEICRCLVFFELFRQLCCILMKHLVWEIYENKNCPFPLSPLLATLIMLLSIIYLNNGFRIDEASYFVIFRMWLERHFFL